MISNSNKTPTSTLAIQQVQTPFKIRLTLLTLLSIVVIRNSFLLNPYSLSSANFTKMTIGNTSCLAQFSPVSCDFYAVTQDSLWLKSGEYTTAILKQVKKLDIKCSAKDLGVVAVNTYTFNLLDAQGKMVYSKANSGAALEAASIEALQNLKKDYTLQFENIQVIAPGDCVNSRAKTVNFRCK